MQMKIMTIALAVLRVECKCKSTPPKTIIREKQVSVFSQVRLDLIEKISSKLCK